MICRIYISGSVGYDEIMDFPGHFKDYFHPDKLHQINVSFAVDKLAKHVGGIATNIAYSLRKTVDYYHASHARHPEFISGSGEMLKQVQHDKYGVGHDKYDIRLDSDFRRNDDVVVYPVAAVGKDGDALLQFFRDNDLSVDHVTKDETLFTTTGKVITDQNDNQIWGYYYGASKKFDFSTVIPNLFRDQGKKSIKRDSDLHRNDRNEQFWILSATHERPFTKVLQHVIKNKLPYLFDPGMTLTWIRDDQLKKGVLGATYVIGNDYEMAMVEKRLQMKVADIVRKGVNVIVTMGEKGVKYVQTYKRANVQTFTLPSFKVKKVVDPTGAGDAWRGGFVGALAAGRPIQECLVMGNVMGSLAVESVGTVEYKPTVREIEKRVKALAKIKYKL